jgi:hypothetical protein
MNVRAMMLGLAAGMVGVLAGADQAAAECAMPSPFFTAGGALAYFFDPGHGPPAAITSPDGQLRVEVMTSTERLRVYRVEPRGARRAPWRLQAHRQYETGVAGQRTQPTLVATGELQPAEAGPRNLLPRLDPARVQKIETSVFAWTCSHQEAQILTPSVAAPAYRVIYATSDEDYRAGRVDSIVLPGSIRRFYGDRRPGDEGSLRLPLGYVSCFGETLAWPTREGTRVPLYVGIIPLFSDGSQGRPPRATVIPPPRKPRITVGIEKNATVAAPTVLMVRNCGLALLMEREAARLAAEKAARARRAPTLAPWLRQILEGMAGFGTGWSLAHLAALALRARRRRRWSPEAR